LCHQIDRVQDIHRLFDGVCTHCCSSSGHGARGQGRTNEETRIENQADRRRTKVKEANPGGPRYVYCPECSAQSSQAYLAVACFHLLLIPSESSLLPTRRSSLPWAVHSRGRHVIGWNKGF
jgi:hypothetical protein